MLTLAHFLVWESLAAIDTKLSLSGLVHGGRQEAEPSASEGWGCE